MEPTPPIAAPPTPPANVQAPPNERDNYGLHLVLFLLTLLTTTIAGAELVTNRGFLSDDPAQALRLADLGKGLPYSLAFLAFLLTHEFGHYFAARIHRVACSLPYCLPFLLPGVLNIGSFGAVIRIRQMPRSLTQFFDIGIAGPLAGFVVGLGILVYGFLALPELTYLFEMNPHYPATFGGVPSEEQLLAHYGQGLRIGNSLLFWMLESTLPDPGRMPNHFEMLHYPFLMVGFLTLFFTALNLLPIGQLDGGHVAYGLFGYKWASRISRLTIVALVTWGGLGLLDFKEPEALFVLGIYLLFLVFVFQPISPNVRWLALLILVVLMVQQTSQRFVPDVQPNIIWLVYALLGVRMVRVNHPRAADESPLTPKRRMLGWLALAIFILCFSPNPLELVVHEPDTLPAVQSQAGGGTPAINATSRQ